MKISPSLLILPIALGAGYFAGKMSPSSSNPSEKEASSLTESSSRKTSIRSASNDPFGGASFDLRSMDDIQRLFKNQGYSTAAARIALSTKNLKADQIQDLMDMVQVDLNENPQNYRARGALMTSLFQRWADVDPTAAIQYVTSCKSRSAQINLAGSCFSAIAAVDPQRAMDEISRLPLGALANTATQSVIGSLAEQDPQLAFEFMQSFPMQQRNNGYYVGMVLSNLAINNPEDAAAKISDPSNNIKAENSAPGVGAMWARKDPDAAIQWANTLSGAAKAETMVQIYRTLSQQDRAAAWERAKSEPGHLRARILGGVLSSISDEDPKAAMAMFQELESKSERRIAANQLLSQQNWRDTAMGFELLDLIDDPSVRREQLGSLLNYAAWTDPKLLDDQLAKMTDREKIDSASNIIYGLSQASPEKAKDFYLSIPEAQRPEHVLSNVVYSLTGKDPSEAMSFALSLSNPQEQSTALSSVFSAWSGSDPEAAARQLSQISNDETKKGAVNTVASTWAQSDPVAARDWANSLTGTERALALSAILPSYARDYPLQAAQELETLMKSPPDGVTSNLVNAANGLARQWAIDDPQAAAKWANNLPDEQSRKNGIQAVASTWAQYDAVGVAQWLSKMEEGGERDSAIRPLVERIRSSDPNTAFSWAASISDNNQRLNEMRNTLSHWKRADLQSARAALEAADVTDEEYDSLSRTLD